MSSDLALYYYYLSYGNLEPFSIKVPPDAAVDDCKQLILRDSRSESPASLTDLYKAPEEHAMYITLEALSVSSLGPPLVICLTMQDIFGLCPQQHRLHLVLVDRGMNRL